jgi:hypothetical protein
MYIWCDLQVYKNLELWICPYDRPSQANKHEKNVTPSIVNISVERGCVVSLLWAWDQDGPLRISTMNAIAAQVCYEWH